MRIQWKKIADDELLELRLCDLPIKIEGTHLERGIKHLYDELGHRQIRFKPHVWLSDEFFTPDGVPGFAIPFYLAHPRLMKLERRQMLELEGGSNKEFMRILRHEAGHSIDNAYYLHRKQSWRDTFGSLDRPYPQSYKPNPTSHNYVLHLASWYAQAHPLEDYAETFAVWLRPRSRWRSRYNGWPALRKLEYIDDLMQKIADTPRKNRSRRQVDPLAELKITLKQYYRKKRDQYSLELPEFYDTDLLRIFSRERKHASRPSASTFVRQYRTEVRRLVAEGTGVHAYTIDHILKRITERARELKLRVGSTERQTKTQFLIMLSVHTMNIVHSGRYRFHYGL